MKAAVLNEFIKVKKIEILGVPNLKPGVDEDLATSRFHSITKIIGIGYTYSNHRNIRIKN